MKAILSAPDQSTWIGKRDYTLLLLAVHTGLRVSELTELRLKDVFIGPAGAHVRVLGKGRKERSTPLTKQTVVVLKSWLNELSSDLEQPLFPSLQGCHLSSDAVQYLLAKYTTIASKHCASLLQKRVTPHSLRHTMAMELLFAGVDRALIALWLGHESIETTQMYLQANLELKEKLLEKTQLVDGHMGRFKPHDKLLEFLSRL